MSMYFTSDTHFGHRFAAERRGYPNREEMDEDLITHWNRVVGKDDLVYHLGDFSFHTPGQTPKFPVFGFTGKRKERVMEWENMKNA